ncbi:MAG: SMEK domain-containing protein [Cyclobacteriaceae bacterium]
MSLVKYQHIIQEINEKLFEIAFKIKCFNKVGDIDINRYAESYFIRILNLLFKSESWELTKAVKINQDTYDLLDQKNKICVQITSRSDKRKKRKTIEMFNKKEHSKDFKKLVILYLSEKKPNSNDININFDFFDLNIIDLASLVEQNCEEQDLLDLRDILKPRYLIHELVAQNGQPANTEDSEEEFKRRIQLEKDLKEQLTVENYYQEIDHEELSRNPYKKFKDSRFILRSYEDKSYPEVNDESKWNRTFMYDFYDRGILIWDDALLGTTARLNTKTEEWYIESYHESKEELKENEERLCIRTLGQLPYSNILHWKYGDEYYNDYHLYCKYYGIMGTPFERIEYRYSYEKDGYFWNEMDTTKQTKQANA